MRHIPRSKHVRRDERIGGEVDGEDIDDELCDLQIRYALFPRDLVTSCTFIVIVVPSVDDC